MFPYIYVEELLALCQETFKFHAYGFNIVIQYMPKNLIFEREKLLTSSFKKVLLKVRIGNWHLIHRQVCYCGLVVLQDDCGCYIICHSIVIAVI